MTNSTGTPPSPPPRGGIPIIERRPKADYSQNTPLSNFQDLRRHGITEVPVMGVSSFKKAPPPTSVFHFHENLEICYLSAGARINYSAGHLWHLNTGHLWINKPGVPHGSGVYPCGPSTLYSVEVSPPIPGKTYFGLPPEEGEVFWKAWLDLPNCICKVPASHATYFNQLLQLAATGEAPWNAAHLRAALHFFVFSTHARLRAAHAYAVHPGIKRAREFIDSTQPEKLPTLKELAQCANLSLSHFKALFRRDMGISPAKFLLNRRLAAAASELATNDRDIFEIAFHFGFSSPQHFSSAFKAYTGETPRRYRENTRT